MDDSIVSKHLRLRITAERQWLGRDSIADLERCWEFVQASAGGRLPSRVLVVIEWQDDKSGINTERSSVTIGMNDPASMRDARGFLIHGAARELARLALTDLMGEGSSRPESSFLTEGMSEILAHEFSGTVRRLGAAWVISHYADLIQPLGFRQLSEKAGSGNSLDLISAAPGVTFLMLCNELYGRDRLLKLFESLEQKSLEESIYSAFRVRAGTLEKQWLSRVRSYLPQEITISPDEPAVELDRVIFAPASAKPGTNVTARVFTRPGKNNLVPGETFLIDEAGGKVMQGRPGKQGEGAAVQFELPLDPTRQDGQCRVQIVAVDSGGNVRIWDASFTVSR